ncbi:CHAD domain-containing protein [Carbonactinospora thermoautotrophica]|uniref:CHAD domain-containing protein n=1 Tax=Carbonactinospora thermoautotrophica TaxID=1469144 RepID=UPI002270DF30|nr:CHAD domain-containing protein [Carbonactinospora thermoautotrophica]
MSARRATPRPLPAPLHPTDPAGAALQHHLHTAARAFLEQDRLVRHQVPGSVERLRGYARRIRYALRTCAPLVEPRWGEQLAVELRWLERVLTAEHDREVALARLLRVLDAVPDDPGSVRARHLLERRLSRELAEARVATLNALSSSRYRLLVDRLTLVLHELPGTSIAGRSCTEVLPALAAMAFRRLARAARRLDADHGAYEEWRHARVLARCGRCAAEVCADVFGEPARAFAGQLGRLVDVLGVHEDATKAAEAARAAANTPRIAPQTMFTLGFLYATERAAALNARREFRHAWSEATKKKWRRWLDETEPGGNAGSAHPWALVELKDCEPDDEL